MTAGFFHNQDGAVRCPDQAAGLIQSGLSNRAKIQQRGEFLGELLDRSEPTRYELVYERGEV